MVLLMTLFFATTTHAQVTPQDCVRGGQLMEVLVYSHHNGVNVIQEYGAQVREAAPFLFGHLIVVATLPRTNDNHIIQRDATLASSRAIHSCVHTQLLQE